MKRILPLLLIVVVPCGLVKAQSGPFLVSTPETSKGGVQAFIKEDSAGARQLQVYLATGTTHDSERIRSADLTARAFDENGKELGLTSADFNGEVLVAVCNAGSCNAIKIYYFSVPKADTDRVAKVVVMFRNKQYELSMEKYSPPKRTN